LQSLLLAAGPEPGAQHQQQQEMDMLDMGIVALTNVLQDDAENAQRLAQVSKVHYYVYR
jgi:hypothetical protein